MSKKPSYDDKFRASAVLMCESQGYPDVPGVVGRVAAQLGIRERTLRRWVVGDQNPPPVQLVLQQKRELADLLEEAAYLFLGQATRPEIVDEMSSQQAMTAAAIAIDKFRLLRGLPTEIVAIIPDVIAAIERMGQKPADVFNHIIEISNDRPATDGE